MSHAEALVVFLALSSTVVVGCESGRATASLLDASPTEQAKAPTAPALAAASTMDADVALPPHDAEDSLVVYESAAPVSGKSVGHTSVVFKLGLEGALTVAYKPRSTRGDHRYRGEIAAYRLARALSLANVPPAAPRSFDYAALQSVVGREAIFADVVKEPDGAVRGAMMPWIKGLEFIPLEDKEWMPKWKAWLKADGDLPADERDLARQISNLLAFDLVTGNWDRWSGGNIGIDRAHRPQPLLLYVDNDGAFFDPPPVKEMKWPTSLFEGVERFSRSFVDALRRVDLAKALGEEIAGTPLLSPRVLAQTESRRQRVVAAIDAKTARLGASKVLAFE